MEKELIEQIGAALTAVRAQKPLVHHLTNYVTVNDCANVTLAIGASPIMADAAEEAADIAAISSALVLNIGTLNERTVKSMLLAGKKANEAGVPVVFDPVGAGASALRNRVTQEILNQVKISVLRGNMSEIRFIAGLRSATKGVDAADADLRDGLESGRQTAESVADKLGCVTAITGVTDIVSGNGHTYFLKNGSKRLSGVTGTGCMCTSLVGSFCGATDNCLAAAAGGILSMSIAGEVAAETTAGLGSFHIALIDAISQMDAQTIAKRVKLHEA